MCKGIYLDAPRVGGLEKEYINKAIDDGYVSTVGVYVPEFEDKFARYLKAKKAVSTQSGTAALHITLYELGIGKGDEVIVPVLTFVATVNPLIYVGAKPVFVDVDIDTWNISPKEIEKNITKNTKAIMPVHLYGNPCAMEEIIDIAERNNLYVIEDATESLGATYENKYTGTFGDFGCFSFNGNKVITTGGGGMIVGKDGNRIAHIRFLVNQARDEVNNFYHSEVGFNYRMTNIEAALGLAQMRRLDNLLRKKKKINEMYKQELKDIDFINFQEEYGGGDSSWWLTVVVFNKDINIYELQNKLAKEGIPTRRIFMPIVEFPPYRKFKDGEYKNSYSIHEKGLCLPSSVMNEESVILQVCKRIRENF